MKIIDLMENLNLDEDVARALGLQDGSNDININPFDDGTDDSAQYTAGIRKAKAKTLPKKQTPKS
jgi:hypothetical protein